LKITNRIRNNFGLWKVKEQKPLVDGYYRLLIVVDHFDWCSKQMTTDRNRNSLAKLRVKRHRDKRLLELVVGFVSSLFSMLREILLSDRLQGSILLGVQGNFPYTNEKPNYINKESARSYCDH